MCFYHFHFYAVDCIRSNDFAGRRRLQIPTASIFRFNQEIAIRLADIRFFNWT